MVSAIREFIRITKALADPNSVRILLALRKQELCVCQIIELFQLAPSTVSKHLSIMNHAGLVTPRKTERWVFYRLPGKETSAAILRRLTGFTNSCARWLFKNCRHHGCGLLQHWRFLLRFFTRGGRKARQTNRLFRRGTCRPARRREHGAFLRQPRRARRAQAGLNGSRPRCGWRL